MASSEGIETTYRVTRCEFLLRPQDRTAALRLVQRRLATHDRLAGRASATGLAPDLRDGVPVIHDCGGICVINGVGGVWNVVVVGVDESVVVVVGEERIGGLAYHL